MYIAKVRQKQGITYLLRESVETGSGSYEATDICDLGPCPGAWIDYPGGNAWYVCPELERRVAGRASSYNSGHLEDLFWPFLNPAIRRSTEAFRSRAKGFTRMGKAEKEALARATHAFDKRRAHFLKFGNMDQGPIVNFPAVLFKPFQEKSRDEIEQWFMAQEGRLRPRELKSYVYTIFDLQRFFQGFMAKKMPHVLDQDKVEAYFLEEICALNQALFRRSNGLHPYLVRYAVFFYDFPYGGTVLLEDLEQDFRARHRQFHMPPSLSQARAREVFSLSREAFRAMDKKGLTRRYRRLARKLHPDTGGNHEAFVELNDAFRALLKQLAE